MCEWRPDFERLDERVDKIESRLDKVEGSITVGSTQVNTSIQNLAQQFGQQMSNLDSRMIEEKSKWGSAYRQWIGLAIKGGITIALVACGCEKFPDLVRGIKLLFQ